MRHPNRKGKKPMSMMGILVRYAEPVNQKDYACDRRFARNQSSRRRVVVSFGKETLSRQFQFGNQAASFIRACVAKEKVAHANEAASWDNLHERFEVKRINHQEAYSLNSARNNMAEEYFSRFGRAEIGIRHHIAGSYLRRPAQEPSWREDNRLSDGDQVNRIAALL
jgi:ISXO2 transposase-like protein